MNHLIWFRNDYRIHDNQALCHAITLARKAQGRCIALAYWSELQWRSHGAGEPKLAATQQAIAALHSSLAKLGVPLLVVDIDYWQQIPDHLETLCQQQSIGHIHAHNEPGLNETNRDKAVVAKLKNKVRFSWFNDLNLIDPTQHFTQQGHYFRVFTAYKKSLLNRLDANDVTPLAPPQFATPLSLNPLKYAKQFNWQNPLGLACTEEDALNTLANFLEQEPRYEQQRDIPNINGTSTLSVALALGLISSRQIAHSLRQQQRTLAASTYFSEIIWRDYYKYLLHHRPELSKAEAYNTKWDQFPWREENTLLIAWQQGQTGVPIVDAAMRQLNETGWMHNRLRMISAMYLCKILQLNWRLGEAYFAQKLADFDLAANNGGWQWVASTGVDATPYFRIFNPYLQSKKFDPSGQFIRKFIPELAPLDNKNIHRPSEKFSATLGYPCAIVNYDFARKDTLEKFKKL